MSVINSFEFKVNTFPKIHEDKIIVLHEMNLNTKTSIIYDLSKLKPIWCDSNLDFYTVDKNLYLKCFSKKYSKLKFENNIDISNFLYIEKKSKTHNKYVFNDSFNPFKFYFYIKKNYYRDKLCLIKNNTNNTYEIYSFVKREDFSKKLDKALKQFKKLSKDEYENLYYFFISFFNTSCEKNIFYYQASLYGFYNLESLFIKQKWYYNQAAYND
jgi:hypothetical protein